MTFKRGNSGNPKGRPKGAISKRVQLAKLLEPHATELVEKMIELALGGDIHALRLCIERLIPKIRYEPIADITIPAECTPRNISSFKKTMLQAVIDGKVSLDDAEKLINIVANEIPQSYKPIPLITTTDPIEAARIYKEIMCS